MLKINPISIFLLLNVFSFFHCATPRKNVEHKIHNTVESIGPGNIRISGYLGEKIDLCIRNRIAAQDEDDLVEPFRHRKETRFWQSEFWGKWFLSAADARLYTGEAALKQKLDNAVAGLLDTQSENGYIGNYAPEAHLQQWDIWGRKYCMLGLLAYYDITKDNNVLKSLKRQADFLLSEVGPGKADIIKTGNYRGMASCSVLEPMVLLYNRTGEQRYLDFARYIVAQWETADGPQLISKALAGVPVALRFPKPDSWWSWENGGKAYEMMSCYDGLLELYKVTRNPEYLQAVRKTVNNIIETEINIIGSGSSIECWYGGKARQTRPAKHMNETCVTQTWMKLLYKLYQLTGDSQLMDQFEITMYNALIGAMRPDGSSFAKYSPLVGVRHLGELQCGMDLNCCTANGPRGMLHIPFVAIMKDSAGPVINLYGDMEARCELPSGNIIHLTQSSYYPQSGLINIQISPERKESFTIKLRKPAWCESARVDINGMEQPGVIENGYIIIDRTWKAGDVVRLQLDMTVKIHSHPLNDPEYIALTRGPVVLARENRLDDVDVDETAKPVTQKNGLFIVRRRAVESPFWMVFAAPFITGDYHEGEFGKPKDLLLCDYASAGGTWDNRSRFRVWLPQALDPSAK
ncbi:glycoside hydrolase family 127 protein [candidate division KSB1 bacterium]|nr:glycoside hydrolase family 127 protein [candidate division KSB1 bacterium]